MNIPANPAYRVLSLLIVALFSCQASAERPGHGHHGHKRDKMESRHPHEYYEPSGREFDHPPPRERYFSENHRGIIQNYYIGEYRNGRCPPGLSKKANGCLPPGHGKRWVVGQRLPRDVIYYDLPPSLIREIGYPPQGYRLVRVASDILMIAVGTGLVMDAIADINGTP